LNVYVTGNENPDTAYPHVFHCESNIRSRTSINRQGKSWSVQNGCSYLYSSRISTRHNKPCNWKILSLWIIFLLRCGLNRVVLFDLFRL